MTVNYFTEYLLEKQVEKVKQERAKIDEMIKNEQFDELKKYEEETLNDWMYWKQRFDIVIQQDQPNTPEQLKEAQRNLSMWNEILLWSKEHNPHTTFKK